MGRCRIVVPGIVRLPLSGGDYLDVTKELNAGEYYDMLIAQSERKLFAKPIAYLVAWSLTGVADAPIPYDLEMPEDERRATIRALDKATIREIGAAIDKHEAAEDAALEAKKKTPSLELASSAP
jgi:hypothetical protein